MKLPSLDELDFDESPKKEEVTAKKKEMSTTLPSFGEQETPKKKKQIKKTEAKQVVEKPNGKPKIPKSQYDSDGNPILMIPDLNDVDLTNEIDRFFGAKEE